MTTQTPKEMEMRRQRRTESDRVGAILEQVRAAADNPGDPRHREAKQLAHKLATDFSVSAKTLLQYSTFWND